MKIMKKNIDGADYQYQRNENNELIVTLEGIYMGKITSLPALNNNDLEKVLDDYIDMRECLFYKEVSYSDLMRLYERCSNCKIELINNTLIVCFGIEIIAVLVDVTDLDFVEMYIRTKLVFYYFTVNEFKPYCINYAELLKYANDVL